MKGAAGGAAPFAKYQGNVTYFIHGNHLGSTTMVYNHTGGTVVQDEIFYPWGERWAYGGTLYDERFASLGRRDAESTLDPTLFRMYESRLYRWLSPDPLAGHILNPQSLNRYGYVLNNPVNFIDPLGLQCNVFNVSWEGSGQPFPCGDASTHTSQPAESPTSIAGPVGVAVGSMIGYVSPEMAEAERNYINGVTLAFLEQCTRGGHCGQGSLSLGGTTYTWVSAYSITPLAGGSDTDFYMADTSHWEITGRIPDYYQFSASFNPFLSGVGGFTVTITVDRYHNMYIGPGVNIAKGFKGSAAFTYGYMQGYGGPRPPSPSDLEKFIKGFSCSAGLGVAFLGKSVEWSSGGRGFSDPILMTPQLGISCGYTF